MDGSRVSCNKVPWQQLKITAFLSKWLPSIVGCPQIRDSHKPARQSASNNYNSSALIFCFHSHLSMTDSCRINCGSLTASTHRCKNIKAGVKVSVSTVQFCRMLEGNRVSPPSPVPYVLVSVLSFTKAGVNPLDPGCSKPFSLELQTSPRTS